MANKFGALVLGLAILAAPAAAQQDGPPRPQLPPLALNAQMTDAQIGAALDPWLAGLQRDDVFNGAFLVARNGQEIYAHAYGTRDLATNAALSVDERFPLASIGKAFTHVAVAQLIQAGRLTPDKRSTDVIPDYTHAHAPAEATSLPFAPARRSSPSPPMRVSSPSPPSSRSSPLSPRITSFPSSPHM